jgi:hypothetical protein
MTLQEKKLLDSSIISSSDNSPPSLLLEEGRKRLAFLLSQLDSALSSINLSKFPEISFISSTLGGRLQTTKWTFSSTFSILESGSSQRNHLFLVEIFTSHAPSNDLVSSSVPSSQPEKKSLLSIHINLSVLPDEQSPMKCSAVVEAKLSTFLCSQSLARFVVSEFSAGFLLS